MLAYCLAESDRLPCSTYGLRALRGWRHEREYLRRIAGSLDVLEHVLPAVPPNIQAKDNVRSLHAAFQNLLLQMVGNSRLRVGSPVFLCRRLWYFEGPAPHCGKHGTEGNARRQGAFASEANQALLSILENLFLDRL